MHLLPIWQVSNMNDWKALQFQEVKEQIAGFARFSLGKTWIRETQPSFDELWIQRESQRTREAMELFIRYGSVPLPGLYDIRPSPVGMQPDCQAGTWCQRSTILYEGGRDGNTVFG